MGVVDEQWCEGGKGERAEGSRSSCDRHVDSDEGARRRLCILKSVCI